MEALKASSFSSFHLTKTSSPLLPTQFDKPISFFSSSRKLPSLFHSTNVANSKFKLLTAISPPPNLTNDEPTETPSQGTEIDNQEEKFDWFSEWYPIMPVCDLDKRAPHGNKVMGLDLVVWWDRNESAWKVFDDSCPHRLAPLSEGRIDQWGRLQCVYHGWCFGGAGDCKFIPQAPRDGPPIHTSKKACVAVYPSTVQNDIIWFWPNTDPQYKDIITKKKPPYIPELDDPTYTKSMGNRDIPYGYEVLTENLMDPAHVPYAHYGILPTRPPKGSVKADREGGRPLNITIEKLDRNGFTAKNDSGGFIFVPPCLFYGFITIGGDSTKEVRPRRSLLIFVCVPVSPGHSRLIFSFPRNFAVWIDRLLPRWIFHIGQNLILDSDLYLLHLEERKIMEIGPSNWQKACFVPTKSDALVVSYRRWLKKYGGGQMDWGADFSGILPPIPPREQLLDRYWTHVVNCTSCSVAYKGLNAVEVTLQVLSVALIGVVAVVKQGTLSGFKRNSLVIMAVLCFAGSRWLSHFIYKNFHYHDYNHAFK